MNHKIWEEGFSIWTETSAKQQWAILGKAEQAHTSAEPCQVTNPAKITPAWHIFRIKNGGSPVSKPVSSMQPGTLSHQALPCFAFTDL